MSRALIIIGSGLILAGLLWPIISKIGLGRLPGDIVRKRENWSVYVPVTAWIIVSVALSMGIAGT